MKIKLIFFILSSTILISQAQKSAIITFDKSLHDYGQIKEENGKVEATFNFTNSGTDTLKVTEAKPSCGCITTNWTKTPIAPGNKGIVKVYFDPYLRPGEFRKSIWVNSNASLPSVTLEIKGNVIPRVKTFIDSFPSRNGNLFFGKTALNLRTISNNKIKYDSLEVFNGWSMPMTLSFASYPSFITLKSVPSTLEPFKRGKIYISYDASKKNDYGMVSDNFIIVTNDTTNANKLFTINAVITDDFADLTPTQKANAPKITFTLYDIDYGTVIDGEIVKKTFEFKNSGKDTLFIRKAVPYMEDCKVRIVGKSGIAGGESSGVEIEFDTAAKGGTEQKRTIILTSNDPVNPFIILVIAGKISAK